MGVGWDGVVRCCSMGGGWRLEVGTWRLCGVAGPLQWHTELVCLLTIIITLHATFTMRRNSHYGEYTGGYGERVLEDTFRLGILIPNFVYDRSIIMH